LPHELLELSLLHQVFLMSLVHLWNYLLLRVRVYWNRVFNLRRVLRLILWGFLRNRVAHDVSDCLCNGSDRLVHQTRLSWVTSRGWLPNIFYVRNRILSSSVSITWRRPFLRIISFQLLVVPKLRLVPPRLSTLRTSRQHIFGGRLSVVLSWPGSTLRSSCRIEAQSYTVLNWFSSLVRPAASWVSMWAMGPSIPRISLVRVVVMVASSVLRGLGSWAIWRSLISVESLEVLMGWILASLLTRFMASLWH